MAPSSPLKTASATASIATLINTGSLANDVSMSWWVWVICAKSLMRIAAGILRLVGGAIVEATLSNTCMNLRVLTQTGSLCTLYITVPALYSSSRVCFIHCKFFIILVLFRTTNTVLKTHTHTKQDVAHYRIFRRN